MAEKKISGKTAASAVVAVTAAGVLVGGAYASPDELLEDGPGPLVQSLDADTSPADDGGGSADEEGSETGEEKRSLRGELGRRVGSQLRIVPEIDFHLDTTLDYAEHIEELLKK